MAAPERTCAGCGKRRPQSRLVRLSVDASGALQVGAHGGRGAYLCPDPTCVERAVRSRTLPRRLRVPVDVPTDLAARVVAGLAGG